MTQNAWEVGVGDGKWLFMVQCTVPDLLLAMRVAPASEAGFGVAEHATKMAVRKIGTGPGDAIVWADVTYKELQAGGWSKHLPRTKQFFRAARSWAKIHLPSDDDVVAFRASEKDGARLLPDSGKTVRMEELGVDAVKRTMSVGADKGSARAFLVDLEGVANAVRGVDIPDDRSQWPLSIRDTQLLIDWFKEVHIGDEASNSAGEIRAVSGSGA